MTDSLLPSAPALRHIPPSADDDPSWVWLWARIVAGVLLALVVITIAGLVVVAADDLRAANGPDHTHDDGHGWAAVFAITFIVMLTPGLVLAIVGFTLCAGRRRGGLVLNLLGGLFFGLVGLTATDAHPAWGLVALAGTAVAVASIAGLNATSGAKRASRGLVSLASRTSPIPPPPRTPPPPPPPSPPSPPSPMLRPPTK